MGDRRYSPPNYTQIPNHLLDELMPEMGLAELKVTMAIARRTFGWGKDERLVSLSELERMTGLSRQSCQEGVKLAMERGFFGRRKQGQAYVYGIRVKEVASQEAGPATRQATRPASIERKKSRKKTNPPTPQGGESDSFFAGQDVGIEATFFEQWKTGTGKNGNTTLTPKRRKMIRKRYEEALKANDKSSSDAISEIETAIAGMVHSQYHIDHGYQSFEQMFRDRERIEMFRDRRLEQLANGNGHRPSANPEYDTTQVNPEIVALQERARAGDAAAIAECTQHGIEWS